MHFNFKNEYTTKIGNFLDFLIDIKYFCSHFTTIIREVSRLRFTV